MSYRGPKVKLARKLNIPGITPKAAKIMEYKPYPPGQHGAKKAGFRGRLSVYKMQLMEKQKLRYQYNISEKQLRNYFKTAQQKSGNTADLLLNFLESRLDSVVFRSGFARSVFAARQYVSHGHITIDGKKVDKPSYLVKIGQVVAVKEKSQQLPCFQEAIASTLNAPEYLNTAKEQFQTSIAYLPEREDIPVICEIHSVIEYYSK